MTKRDMVIAGVAGWIAVHVGLVAFGAVLGIVIPIPFEGNGGADLRCEEDELAIHGGLDDWYDPDMPLECVNFEEFPNRAFLDGYDNGYSDGFMEGLNETIVLDAEPAPVPTASSIAAMPVPTQAPEPLRRQGRRKCR